MSQTQYAIGPHFDWTNDDQTRALSEGWGVFDNSDHGLRIERHDEAQRFDCDAAAQAYVAMRALNGGAREQKAIRWLAWIHAVDGAASDF